MKTQGVTLLCVYVCLCVCVCVCVCECVCDLFNSSEENRALLAYPGVGGFWDNERFLM